jgi:hypothetical protein
MGRRYFNLEKTFRDPVLTSLMFQGASWHSSHGRHSMSSDGSPAEGLFNRAAVKRKVSVWAYLVS